MKKYDLRCLEGGCGESWYYEQLPTFEKECMEILKERDKVTITLVYYWHNIHIDNFDFKTDTHIFTNASAVIDFLNVAYNLCKYCDTATLVCY